MATSRINSLVSMFERNENLRMLGQGRLITSEAHDETYYGLPQTVSYLEKLINNGEYNGRIQVYSRGKEIKEPKLEYDSENPNSKYPTASIALEKVREIDRQECIKRKIQDRIEKIRASYDRTNNKVAEVIDVFFKAVEEELD